MPSSCATEWNEFRVLDLVRLTSCMKGNVLLDARNPYELETAPRGGFL